MVSAAADLSHELRAAVHAPEEGVHAPQILQLVLLDEGDEAAVLHLRQRPLLLPQNKPKSTIDPSVK